MTFFRKDLKQNLCYYNDFEDSNIILKINVAKIDQEHIYYVDSFLLLQRNYEESEMSTLNNENFNSHSHSHSHSQNGFDRSFDHGFDYGFDFDFGEKVSCDNNLKEINVISTFNQNQNYKVKKNILSKEEISKKKLDMTTKFIKQSKIRPYGVLKINEKNMRIIKELTFPNCSEVFKRGLLKLRIKFNAYICQLLSFETIKKGENLTMIGVPRSGLTMASILPILSKIDQNILKQLNVLILVKNDMKGKFIQNIFQTLLDNKTHSKVKIVFIDEINDGIQESTDIITANILIGSVKRVLDAVENNFVIFDHLKSVIIDDADIVIKSNSLLCQQLFDTIMNQNKLFEREKGNIQIIINGHKWTNELKSFISAFCKNDKIYIFDPIQMITYLSNDYDYIPKFKYFETEDKKFNDFYNYAIEIIKNRNMLVFTKTALETEMLYERLLTMGINVLRGTGFLDPGKVYDLNTIWCATNNNSTTHYIFIVSDCAILKLNITDAYYIYHYTLPFSKQDLKNRLGCSLSCYQQKIDNNIQNVEYNQIFAICSEDNCTNLLYILTHITMINSDIKIDDNINNISKNQLIQKESKHALNLCNQLKLYGVCLNEMAFCQNSHIPSIINQNISNIYRGCVTFTVTTVRNCGHIWGIIEHFSSGCTKLDKKLNDVINENRMELLNDLTFDMQLNDDLQPIEINSLLNQENTIFVCKDNTGTYYRCKLIDVFANDPNLKYINVFCIDLGIIKHILKTDIFNLSEPYKSMKPLAFEFIFTSYLPKDRVYGWPSNLNSQLSEAIVGKCVDSHIVYGYNNTIWIDTLYERSKLGSIEKSVVNFSLNQFFKSNKSGEKSDQLLNFIEKLSFLPNINNFKNKNYNINTLIQVQLCEFNSKSCHINILNDSKLKEIEILIKEYINKNDNISRHFRIGEYCLAKFVDNEWYRAKIIKFNEKNLLNNFNSTIDFTYDVYMVDIGETVTNLSFDSLLLIPFGHELLTFNDQAIKCSLFGADFSGFKDDVLDNIFEFLDSLHFNLYSKFNSDYYDSSIVHEIQLFYSNDQNNSTFTNVLFDLFLKYNLEPTLDFKNVRSFLFLMVFS